MKRTKTTRKRAKKAPRSARAKVGPRRRTRVAPRRRAVRGAATAAVGATAGGVLAQGDKVPNMRERDAVGPFTKRIRRTDPAFATFVSNDNPAIVFKDEEKTGADRMMTVRLKTGLDALAAAVGKEWTGVKLRVTEAWDENGEHAPKSLHYEGRCADITTSPIDGAKLGRLARLAVDAGLEWVFFEDSRHVHVSMS